MAGVLYDCSDQKGKTQLTFDFAFNSAFNGIHSRNKVRLWIRFTLASSNDLALEYSFSQKKLFLRENVIETSLWKMLNLPYKYPKWELKTMHIKQPMKVFWKIKVSETDLSETSWNLRIFFRNPLKIPVAEYIFFFVCCLQPTRRLLHMVLQGFWSQISKWPFLKHDSKTANAHLCFDETKLTLVIFRGSRSFSHVRKQSSRKLLDTWRL